MGGSALVLGASGSLGKSLCSTLFLSNYWKQVITVGLGPWISTEKAVDIHQHIQIDKSTSMKQQLQMITKYLNDSKLNAIYCVAGGFEMGPMNSDPLSFLDVAQSMLDKNVSSVLLASSIAMQHLESNGLLILTGSKSAIDPLSNMVQYGMSKNMVHYLTKSLGSSKHFPGKIIAILPTILDTIANRQEMPKADKSGWIPLQKLSDLLCKWGQDSSNLKSGGLYTIEMKGSEMDVKLS